VVDWASDPAAATRLREAHAGVRLLAEAGNRGFGAGVNLAARCARAPRLLLLNPDAVLDAPITPALGAYLDAHPRVGVVGPRIVDADGTLQASARRFPGVSTLAGGRSTWLTRAWPGNPVSRRNLLAAEDGGPRAVDWVSGACLLIRREAFESVGGFDEGFFLYWEDADLCRRLAARGWATHYLPDVVVRHAAGRSSRHARTRAQVAFHRSVYRYFRKHAGRGWQALSPAVWLALQGRLALRLLTTPRD
jgi:GT2 family glycosyltransferase